MRRAPRSASRLLPPAVIERIAAGEIIERPASVVRELIENALDAGATNLRVELREGGMRLLRVSDDGFGISADDLELACLPHATSKVRELDDLTRVRTLGFRGEALASIAAVAEIEIASAPDDSGLASVLAVGSGHAAERTVASRSRGTMVTVRHLFSEMPARRALLRGPAAEASRVSAVVRAYALAHPSVRFTLISDGSFVLQTNGKDVSDVLATLYGEDVARSSVPFGPLSVGNVTFHGVISARGIDAPDRSHVLLAINGRPVSNRALLAAAEGGYRPLFRKGRHPVLVVHFAAPPDELDVNIHPAKAQVLLRGEQAIAATLRSTIHDVLGNVPPAIGDQVSSAASASLGRAVQLRLPASRSRRGAALAEGRMGYLAGAHEQDLGAGSLPELESLGQLDDALIVARTKTGHLFLIDQHRAHERILYDVLKREATASGSLLTGPDSPDFAGQLLLMPVLVELSPIQARLLLSRLNALASIGLEVQHFGGTAFLVRSLPPLPTGILDPAEIARDIARDAAEDADDWLDHVRISLACRSAIRRGQTLSPEEQRSLLEALRGVRTYAVCPHGSPLILRYSKRFLAHAFDW